MPIMFRLETEVRYDKEGNKINVATEKAKEELKELFNNGEAFQICIEDRTYKVETTQINSLAFVLNAKNEKEERFQLRCSFKGSYCEEYQNNNFEKITLNSMVQEEIYRDFIRNAVHKEMDIIIIGGLATGKTTLVKAILNDLRSTHEYSFNTEENTREIESEIDVSNQGNKEVFVKGELACDDDYSKYFNNSAALRITTSHCKSIGRLKEVISPYINIPNRKICVIQMSLERSKRGIYSIGIID